MLAVVVEEVEVYSKLYRGALGTFCQPKVSVFELFITLHFYYDCLRC